MIMNRKALGGREKKNPGKRDRHPFSRDIFGFRRDPGMAGGEFPLLGTAPPLPRVAQIGIFHPPSIKPGLEILTNIKHSKEAIMYA